MHKMPKIVVLFLHHINVINQHRKIFSTEDIDALISNICLYGLLDPVIVASFSAKSAQEYVDLINKFYKTNHFLAEMKQNPDNGEYQFVLSGERRLRAHWSIWNNGCYECRKKNGEEEPGTCYQRHFRGLEKANKGIEARLYRGLSAIEAMDIQLSGNSYVPPTEQEMFETYALQFLLKKQTHPKLTIAKFARSVGKAPSTMSGYLKVYNLPPDIYKLFQAGYISFGIAEELAFLKDHGENDLMYWANWAMSKKKLSVTTFRASTRLYLKKKNQTILEIFEEGSEKQMRRHFIRRTVAEEMVGDLHLGLAYWKKVLRFFEEGMLGKEDSPFSERSPLGLYRKQLDLIQKQILPHLEKFLPQNHHQEFRHILEKVSMVVANSERALGQQNIASL